MGKNLDNYVFWATAAAIITLGVYFGGNNHTELFPAWIFQLIELSFASLLTYVGIRKALTLKQNSVRIFNGIVTTISFFVSIDLAYRLISGSSYVANGVTLGFLILLLLIGISVKLTQSIRSGLHPALTFVLSFAALMLFGAFMLKLPGSTVNGISFLDALFTSVSAVSVTGLAVLDTNKDFTVFGQVVIVFLIQMGGLGILTFSNLFALLFTGGSTFRDQIIMADFINSEKVGQTQRMLFKLIIFVLIVELVGAILIYISVLNTPLSVDKIFFSVFHSISAFCNAGFSILSGNLFDPEIRENYFMHTIIAFLIIFGGLGFNISLNYTSYAKYYGKIFWQKNILKKEVTTAPLKIIRINTIIVVRTTIVLLLIGWVAFFILEYNNTLKDLSLGGKIAVAFFNSVTPRTAGFNNIDMGLMLTPTVLISILLMWIGASPGSTGGGIKTTTLAVTMMNLKNQILGNNHIEIRKRQIPDNAVERASVIIILSLIAIGAGILTIAIFDPKIDILKITYECFSAFSTVGLSMNLTPLLSDASQCVLIALMFLGRVSLLTFLMAIIRQFAKPRNTRYEYPKEDIFIN
jgi:potassium uptake TrkH family protein